jgi:hypothetical protein
MNLTRKAVSTNSSRTMNYFTSMHNNTKINGQEQQQTIAPPTSSVASSSTKRFSPFKNIIGPAERMLRATIAAGLILVYCSSKCRVLIHLEIPLDVEIHLVNVHHPYKGFQ